MTRKFNFPLELCIIIWSIYSCNSSTLELVKNESSQYLEVGVARIEIMPETPIRLAGYAARGSNEAQKVIHRLEAKALAFGNDKQKPSILITMDLVGIPAQIYADVVKNLSEAVGIDASRIAICASHTHGGPEVGNLLNILQARLISSNDSSDPLSNLVFTDSLLPLNHLINISKYTEQLKEKLKEVSIQALKNRETSIVSWGQGEVGFAKNRRTEGGPVDHSMPMLKVESMDGELKAVLVNYACHGTTIGAINEIYGDWISEAQKNIEERHPSAIAMVAIGCGGDSNPHPRNKIEYMKQYGIDIADEVDVLLKSKLEPITQPPVAKIKLVNLPFSEVPSIQDFMEQSNKTTIKGYYSRLAIDRILRGDKIPTSVSYPIQVWTFGDKMVMVNLPGEVVVDYSLRLKKEIGADVLWVNAYTNDVPSYIPSKRILEEGGYEAEQSMYWYDKPSSYKPEIEDIIVGTVHDLLPDGFLKNNKN